ncbi:radical SAM/SPASM domain-containing protein [Streptomyces sp. NPDC051452]|uniref:radical SAM/SPASM domain-containing protein n=1 Tax=Streptomyces sp. NPDC051452 TaxID=3365654 RepID=UPI00379BDAE4
MTLPDRAYLQVHPTRRCNLRCLHCYSSSGPDVAETTELSVLKQAVADAAALGYDVLGVSGGEPTLYRPLDDLLRTARSHGMRTTVTSNGMLLTGRRLSELAGLVDVLAISLDGVPDSHVRMRQDPRSFAAMQRRLPLVRDSGIPFGFIFTLTQFNIQELAWVADFAVAAGAALLQIHPLEAEGNAVGALPDAVPDVTEMLFSVLEAARLRTSTDLVIQLDLVERGNLVSQADRFRLGDSGDEGDGQGDGPAERLSSWLSPLVVETDGTVVPFTYGFDRRFALGNLHETPLSAQARTWDPAPFRDLCRRVHADLASDYGPAFVNWYDEVTRASRASLVG